ncbi:MAG: DUF4336 domain-containing protein [Parvularcula sp.]|jgi:hypothetical protein|nr:DUF4336 domain-containing protein [Parvularcula sp.]
MNGSTDKLGKALTQVAPGIWTAEGPVVPYALGPFTVPCPTRMTIIRNPRGELLIHSPIALEDGLAKALTKLGTVSAILVPNSFHHLFAASWLEAYPSAVLYTAKRNGKASGLDKVAKRGSEALAADWAGALRTHEVDAGAWSEIALFHEPTKTLVLTDLMQNFDLSAIGSPTVRALLRIGGAASAHPSASLEMRLPVYLNGRRKAVRNSFAAIRSWSPERILITHGPQPKGDPAELLRRGFAWA